MPDHQDYLIERAKYMDKLAHTSLPENYPENRKRAFELRKKARENPEMDEFEMIPDDQIEDSISLFRSLSNSDRLTDEQQSLVGRAINIVEAKHSRGKD